MDSLNLQLLLKGTRMLDKEEGMAKRVNPVVEVDSDQMEAMFGRLLEEGESGTVTFTVVRSMDSGNYELEVDREESSDEDAEADKALGYPRSVLFPKKPAPDISAQSLI